MRIFIFLLFLFLGNMCLYAQPTSLQEAIRLALENNPILETQRAQLQTAKSLLLQTMGAYDPLLELRIIQSDSQRPREFIFQPSRTKSLSTELSLAKRLPTNTDLTFKSALLQTEDDSTFAAINPKSSSRLEFAFRQALLKGAIKQPEQKQIEELKLEIRKSELQLNRATEDLILQTAKSFFQFWLSQELLNLSRSSEEDARKFLDITFSLKKLGLVEEEDILRAEASYLSRQSETLSAQTEFENSWNSLLKMVGLPRPHPLPHRQAGNTLPKGEGERVRGEGRGDGVALGLTKEMESLIPSLNDSINTALKERSDILSNKIVLEQATLKKFQVFAANYPELDLLGGYGLSGLKSSVSESFSQSASFSLPSWNIGFYLRYPFGSKKGKGETLRSESILSAAKAQLLSTENAVEEGLRNTLNAFETAQKKLKIFQEIEKKEEKILDLMKKKYSQGRISSREVLQSEDSLRAKRSQTLLAKKSLAEIVLTHKWQEGTLLKWQQNQSKQ